MPSHYKNQGNGCQLLGEGSSVRHTVAGDLKFCTCERPDDVTCMWNETLIVMAFAKGDFLAACEWFILRPRAREEADDLSGRGLE